MFIFLDKWRYDQILHAFCINPYYIHPDAGEYLPFAGLYDIWENPEGIEIYSFTIITTQPTVNLKAIHNRMPVILEPDAEDGVPGVIAGKFTVSYN
jgi:putative SOS response-associated peptidase YedK